MCKSDYRRTEIGKLGKRMSTRQQALATAQVYVRRFYSKVEIRRTNPYLVLATAFYLACKMEECPQHIRVVVGEARNTWPGTKIRHGPSTSEVDKTDLTKESIVSDPSKLGECEFFLISEMNSQLIVHHPYRTLVELQGRMSMSQDEITLAWSVINDHYLTDLPLLYPPHVIAVTAILLAVVLKPSQASLHAAAASVAAVASAAQAAKESPSHVLQSTTQSNARHTKPQKLVTWLAAESEINIEDIISCTQEIISLYEVWEQYNEKICKEQIARFVKGRGLDK